MKAIPQTLQRLGWNRRPLTLDDFETFCEAERITIIEHPCDEWGYFFEPAPGLRAIALDTRLDTFNRTHVAWHEAGHAIWHAPGHYLDIALIDAEADIVAHCALLPRPLLFTRTYDELRHDYPDWLIVQRVALFRRSKL
jgi:hypothetical protein